MATISQIRGMLLEEAVLHLLRTSGYTPVISAGTDPTLNDGHSGLEVFGRGGKHQIDAIADPIISLPFSNSSRLIVEAMTCPPKTGPVLMLDSKRQIELFKLNRLCKALCADTLYTWL